MKSLVIREIVEKNLCIGCVLCTAICPSFTQEMDGNRYGEYNPVRKAIINQSGNSDGKRKNPACRLYPGSSAGIFSLRKRIKPGKIINPFRKKALVLMIQLRRFFP